MRLGGLQPVEGIFRFACAVTDHARRRTERMETEVESFADPFEDRTGRLRQQRFGQVKPRRGGNGPALFGIERHGGPVGIIHGRKRNHAKRRGRFDNILWQPALVFHRHAFGNIDQYRQTALLGKCLLDGRGRLQQHRNEHGQHRQPGNRQTDAHPLRHPPRASVEVCGHPQDASEHREHGDR